MFEFDKGENCPFTDKGIDVGSKFCDACKFNAKNEELKVLCGCTTAREFSSKFEDTYEAVKDHGPSFDEFLGVLSQVAHEILEDPEPSEDSLRDKVKDAFLTDPNFMLREATTQIVAQVANIATGEADRLGEPSFRKGLIDNVIRELQKL